MLALRSAAGGLPPTDLSSKAAGRTVKADRFLIAARLFSPISSGLPTGIILPSSGRSSSTKTLQEIAAFAGNLMPVSPVNFLRKFQ